MTYIPINTVGAPGVPSTPFVPNQDTTYFSVYSGVQIPRPSYGTPTDDQTGKNKVYHGGVTIPGSNIVMAHHCPPSRRR